ncbi:MAG: acyl-CoA thioesterase [Christensenellales bacterium]|jgi:acyl-CoA thioester hydrolase
MKMIECKIRVRYSEVGRQGFAHHANYFNWFDIALEELIRKCGMSYKDIEDLGYFFAPITDKCKYIHPANYNDELTVRLTVSDLSSVKVKFIYKILREKDAKLIAMGQTDHVFVDKSFRPHSLQKVMPILYGMIKEMI